MVWNVHTMLQIILTSISTGTGPNETWSVPAIFNPYMYLFWLSQIFYESLYLYFKNCFHVQFDYPSMKMVMSLYIVSYTLWQEYWNRDSRWLFLLPSVNTLLFREISTFPFNFDWFTWNYKDQTDSKLPERGFCEQIILKTRVLQGDMLRGCNRTLGSLYWDKNKSLVSSPESWFLISEHINFDRFTNQLNYQASSDSNLGDKYGLP